jgi:AraC family ethanolamine operon transcriptional activator
MDMTPHLLASGRLETHDPSAFEVAVRPWDLMIDTCGAKSVRFEIDYLLMPGLTIYHDSYVGCAARLQGMPPPNKLVVAVPSDARQDSAFWSRQVSPGALYTMHSTPLDARMSDGHGNWVAFIDLSADLPAHLQSVIDHLQSSKRLEGISGSQDRSPGLVEIMRQLLRAAALADPAQRDAALVALRAEFERRLCHAVQPDGSGRESARSRNKQSRAVRTLLECLQSEELGTSSVDQLCKKIQVNYRTLARGVQAEFGCSVYTLLRRQRLHGARQRLLSAAPLSGTTVTDVAVSFGFFDLGRFSAAYRREFGEYPSKTLATRSNAVQPVLAQA